MAIVIKTIKGRKYAYNQTSKRVGKKVKTKSKYLGPLNAKGLVNLFSKESREHLSKGAEQVVKEHFDKQRENVRRGHTRDMDKVEARQEAFQARDKAAIWERAVAEEKAASNEAASGSSPSSSETLQPSGSGDASGSGGSPR